MTEFSKKTGDYASLSATDIRVMAVTYMLETQHVGSNHLRQEPLMKPTVNFNQPGAVASVSKDGDGDSSKSQLVTAADLNMPGFYRPEDDDEEEEDGSQSTSSTTTTDSEEGETEEEKRKVRRW